MSNLGLNESIRTRTLKFSYSFIVRTCTVAYYAYLNFQNKSIKPSLIISTKFVVPTMFLFFVAISKNLIMADDATTFSNPPVMLVEVGELEKASFYVNVFQWLCEEPIRRVMHI